MSKPYSQVSHCDLVIPPYPPVLHTLTHSTSFIPFFLPAVPRRLGEPQPPNQPLSQHPQQPLQQCPQQRPQQLLQQPLHQPQVQPSSQPPLFVLHQRPLRPLLQPPQQRPRSRPRNSRCSSPCPSARNSTCGLPLRIDPPLPPRIDPPGRLCSVSPGPQGGTGGKVDFSARSDNSPLSPRPGHGGQMHRPRATSVA